MNQDLPIFVCTHGRFGEELVHSAEMIIGEVRNVKVFSLLEGMSPEEYRTMIEGKLKEANGKVLCLVDLFGGTPSNLCVILSREYEMDVLSGLNLAMFIEIVSQVEYCKPAELITTGLSALRESGKNVLDEFSKIELGG